jgi:hypothetical protein
VRHTQIRAGFGDDAYPLAEAVAADRRFGDCRQNCIFLATYDLSSGSGGQHGENAAARADLEREHSRLYDIAEGRLPSRYTLRIGRDAHMIAGCGSTQCALHCMAFRAAADFLFLSPSPKRDGCGGIPLPPCDQHERQFCETIGLL